MNKTEYLNQLKTYLARLPEEERSDILRDQEELIRDAVSSGRSEQDIIQSLGDPKVFASSLIAESRIQKLEASTSINSAVKNSWPAFIAVLGLAPFNLIFVLGPFIALFFTLFAFWCVSLTGIFVSGAFLVFFFTEAITVNIEAAIHFSTLLMILGTMGFFSFLTGIMLLLTRVFIKVTVMYLKWNLKLVKEGLGERHEAL